jgi:proteasome accessory factor B
LQLIQSRSGLKIQDLAELCERHERTVYRDLKTLNESGVPNGFDKETNGYKVQTGFFMPPVELTVEEAMAMVALLEQVDDDTRIPFLETAQRVAEKIRSQLSPALLREVETLDDSVQIDLARRSVDNSDKEVYRQMRAAIINRRVVQCAYDSVHSSRDDVAQTFDFRPFILYYGQRAWYAIGRRSDRADIRALKLTRFSFVKATEQPYHIPEDFDLRTFYGKAWRMIRGDQQHDVAIRFTPRFAETVSETRWHPTQQEQWHEDGSLTLTFTVDGLDEIVWWIMGYGPGARVLGPEPLIAKMKQLTRDAAALYA